MPRPYAAFRRAVPQAGVRPGRDALAHARVRMCGACTHMRMRTCTRAHTLAHGHVRTHMYARALTHAAQAAVDGDVGRRRRRRRRVTTVQLARAARALREGQAAQAGLSESSSGALAPAGLGADVARLHAWLRAARRAARAGGAPPAPPPEPPPAGAGDEPALDPRERTVVGLAQRRRRRGRCRRRHGAARRRRGPGGGSRERRRRRRRSQRAGGGGAVRGAPRRSWGTVGAAVGGAVGAPDAPGRCQCARIRRHAPLAAHGGEMGGLWHLQIAAPQRSITFGGRRGGRAGRRRAACSHPVTFALRLLLRTPK